MHADKRHFYHEAKGVKAEMLEIAYKGGDVSMVFILPFEGVPIKEVEERMRDFSWGEFYDKGTWVRAA